VLAYLAVMVGGTGLWEQVRVIFSSRENMQQFIQGFGPWAPVAFFLIQVVQVVISPIPGGITVVAGAILFGTVAGLGLSLVGAVIGSVIVFYMGRKWGRPLIAKIIGKKMFTRYIGVLDGKGIWLFVIFLLPFLPDDAVCALAGMSALSFRRFLPLVIVGRFPSMAMTVLVTNHVMEHSIGVWIVAGGIIVVLSGLGIWYRDRLESWVLRRAGQRE
ncbi:TVP38/TMEM64 family protein, partial [Paludifilum halophilum]